MRHLKLVLTSVAAFGLWACTPGPEEVCAHADKVAQEGKAKPIENCVKRLEMKQNTRPKEYRQLAPCVMDAKNVEALNGCLASLQGG